MIEHNGERWWRENRGANPPVEPTACDMVKDPLRSGDRVYHIDGWLGVVRWVDNFKVIYVDADNGVEAYRTTGDYLYRVDADAKLADASRRCARTLWNLMRKPRQG